MAGNARVMRCSADDVFSTLADGWLYPVWVVGASRMRDVSPRWPAPGTKIHHSVGVWPVLVDDTTEVVEWTPPRRARLRPKGGPLGRAIVVIDVREHPEGCVVRIGEEPVGPARRAIPRFLWAPLLRARNHESLRRLAFIAEGRRKERDAGEQTARPGVPDPDGEPNPQAQQDAAESTDSAHARALDADVRPADH